MIQCQFKQDMPKLVSESFIVDKAMYDIMSRHANACQYHNAPRKSLLSVIILAAILNLDMYR